MPHFKHNTVYDTEKSTIMRLSRISGNFYTDVPEIEDVQGQKRVAPPPTDQTRGPKWSIFWRGTTCGIQLRGTEAILEFRPMSGDTGVLYQNLGLFSDPYLNLLYLS